MHFIQVPYFIFKLCSSGVQVVLFFLERELANDTKINTTQLAQISGGILPHGAIGHPRVGEHEARTLISFVLDLAHEALQR
jgi:hypothetical protein